MLSIVLILTLWGEEFCRAPFYNIVSEWIGGCGDGICLLIGIVAIVVVVISVVIQCGCWWEEARRTV